MSRKSLGRGLDALLESTVTDDFVEVKNGAATVAGVTFMMVAPDRIVPSPFQPRRHFDAEKLGELASAIRSQGIIEPLIVRRGDGANGDAGGGGRFELIAGERRLRAARAAGLTEVPVIVRELDDRAALETALVENIVREELNAIEEARAYVVLNREFAMSHDEIAERVGKSRPYVTNTMRLLELAAPVVQMAERGELKAGQVRPLLALPAELQIEAARRIVEGRIPSRGVEELASKHRRSGARGGGRSRAEIVDANLSALADSIQRSLKRKVRIIKRRGRAPGRIEIEYYNDEDLTALASTLTASGRGLGMPA